MAPMSSTGTTRHPVGNLIPQPDYRTIDGPEIGTVQPFRNKTRNSEGKKTGRHQFKSPGFQPPTLFLT